ncbi:transmembrane protein 104-like isoform X2 [Bolinopsis microptera]|uniref:transmembrane protein 104-like isoform X2 n=1 Tax=Bolinopsis microptera TaxID=2820187 RepID=UPI00307906DF
MSGRNSNMASHTDVGSQMSSPMAFIFVFNLLLGAGALALPAAFADAGWLVSTVLLVILCFASFVSASFMCEGMAIANVLQNVACPKKNDNVTETEQLLAGSANDTEYYSNLSLQISQSQASLGGSRYSFRISKRIEMAEMAEIFFNKVGVVLFYVAVIIYLYGDLAIYTVAVPKSLANVSCIPDLRDEHNVTLCWNGVSHDAAYRIFVLIYVLCIGPFVFFNAQKTTLLQIFSSILRHTSFFIMVVIAIDRIMKHKHGVPKPQDVKPVIFDKIPDFIGVSVYCFMCQHSLPSFITPMKNQNRATPVLLSALAACLGIYAVVCYTATFSFENLEDVYTLNFANFGVIPIRYFLELYPVFCLTASYPIIGITLRNNLKTLFSKEEYPWLVDRVVFPLLTIIPPTIIGMCTENVEFLVSYTGAFSGAAIQYIIPACFVLLGRIKIKEVFGREASSVNKNHSVFSSNLWPVVLLVWAGCCMAFVLYYKINAAFFSDN